MKQCWLAIAMGLLMVALGHALCASEGRNTPAMAPQNSPSSYFADGGRIEGGRKNYWISFEARVFFSQLDGFMEYKNSGSASPGVSVSGDHLDFQKDLGIGASRAILIPEISLNFIGRQVLRLSYFSIADTADTTLERTFVFGGNQFTSNDRIHSEFELRVLRFRYEWGLFNFTPISLAMGFGADAVWVHAHVDDLTAGTTMDTGHRVGGVPILELRLRINFPYGVGIEGHVEGMHVGVGYVGRGSVGLDWQILRFLSFQGGYQMDFIGVRMRDINGVSAESRLAGAFFSVTAWF